jgi:tetratricopeptide (TPR) repeat protein
MRNTISLLLLILIFNACSSDKVVAHQDEKKYDLTPYLQKLDSAGLDITNDTLLFDVGYQSIYYGENELGNALITYALSKRDSITDEDYHGWSVQNTKNGNYGIAIDKLEKTMKLNPQEGSAYYGWVLLYYYRDYEKALAILEQHDAYTPNLSDAPMGEDIHYLKGLCHMQMQRYDKALKEFNTYITNLATTHGEDFVDVYTFIQKGRCLTPLKRFDEALLAYQKAIHYYENCTDAYYFMGLTHLQMKEQDSACRNFNTALNLIQKGHKSTDTYVEYFHEIYPQQIEETLLKSCK